MSREQMTAAMDTVRALLVDRPLAIDEPTWCGLAITIGDARTLVVVKPTSASRVIVAAQVCPVRAIEPAIALQYNSIAAHGSLAIEMGATYVLRDIVSLDELDATIDALAREAIRLRTNALHSADGTRALAHFAD